MLQANFRAQLSPEITHISKTNQQPLQALFPMSIAMQHLQQAFEQKFV